jgi:hypothetical protein
MLFCLYRCCYVLMCMNDLVLGAFKFLFSLPQIQNHEEGVKHWLLFCWSRVSEEFLRNELCWWPTADLVRLFFVSEGVESKLGEKICITCPYSCLGKSTHITVTYSGFSVFCSK